MFGVLWVKGGIVFWGAMSSYGFWSQGPESHMPYSTRGALPLRKKRSSTKLVDEINFVQTSLSTGVF